MPFLSIFYLPPLPIHHYYASFCCNRRSVSLVPPVYYAHLAAFRGRAMLMHDHSDSASDASFSSNSEPVFCDIHPNLSSVMFWA